MLTHFFQRLLRALKKGRSGIELGLICLLLAGCATARPPEMPGPTALPGTLENPPPQALLPAIDGTNMEAEVERLLQSMTLEQRVGQLMVVALRDRSVTPAVVQTIRSRHVGGVILFARNLGAPQQSHNLITALQALARESGANIPLFIAVDQEGGLVNRATEGVTIWPSQMLLGATGDPALVEQAARLTAVELRALGLNMNLAPVLDVNNNPANPVIGTRSFGADPALAATLGVHAIRAYQQAGVVSVGKHFPGHGDTDIDSHFALPVIDKTIDDLEQVELAPFRAAIDAGVDGIMTAHIALPVITGADSATLSAPMLTGVLRERLGFDGLIITDDLEMGAIIEQYSTAEAALRAFRAGADLLLFRFTEDQQRAAYAMLLDAVRSDPALRERLDQSVRRILRVKFQRGILAQTPAPALALVGSAEHRAVAIETAASGITLVRNDAHRLPLDPSTIGRIMALSPDPADLAYVETPVTGAMTLGQAVAQRHHATQSKTYRLDPAPPERAALQAAARDADLVIIGTYNTHQYNGQRALVEELLATGKPVVVVSLRLPYDLAHLPAVDTYLATYDNRRPTLIATTDILFGARQPGGHLPAPIGELYPLGHGIPDFRTPALTR